MLLIFSLGLVGLTGQRVRFHFISIGSLINIHSVFIEGHTLQKDGRTIYAVQVFPGASQVVDVDLRNAGSFILASDLLIAGPFGQSALVTVYEGPKTNCKTGKVSKSACSDACESSGFAFDRYSEVDSQGCYGSCTCKCKPAKSLASCASYCSSQINSQASVFKKYTANPIVCSGVCICE